VEELEAVGIVDTLRRAAWEVTAAGVGGTTVTASRGVRLAADVPWEDVDPGTFDLIVIPGGAEGTRTLSRHAGVLGAVRALHAAGRPVGAICAGPLVLQAAGVLRGRKATCHPSVRSELTDAVPVDDRVARDGNVFTSRGPGTVIEFALELIAALESREAAETVARGMVVAGF
jgi:4-methyl-5(b-hydroxyethyl)-thiazole monophosphate biosynthesis